jgi:deazaflavin-dependent oxidoreductase (nitroreductase family)
MHRFDRWMYRGGRPNRVARVLNRMWAIQFSTGILPKRLVTLEVRGRRTGLLISFPLVVADYEGERYLVAMLGEKANWVHNVRANGGRAVLRHGRHEKVRLEEVEPGARAPILRRYVAVAPGGRSHLPVDRHASLAEFEADRGAGARLPHHRRRIRARTSARLIGTFA